MKLLCLVCVSFSRPLASSHATESCILEVEKRRSNWGSSPHPDFAWKRTRGGVRIPRKNEVSFLKSAPGFGKERQVFGINSTRRTYISPPPSPERHTIKFRAKADWSNYKQRAMSPIWEFILKQGSKLHSSPLLHLSFFLFSGWLRSLANLNLAPPSPFLGRTLRLLCLERERPLLPLSTNQSPFANLLPLPPPPPSSSFWKSSISRRPTSRDSPTKSEMHENIKKTSSSPLSNTRYLNAWLVGTIFMGNAEEEEERGGQK